MVVKLPKFHLDSTVSSIFSKIQRFAYRAVELIEFHEISINMTVLPQFIDKAADGLIRIIEFRGKEPEARRRLGPDWKTRIKSSVWHDICSALHFASRVVDEYGIRDKFWKDSRDWFGPNYRLLEGSYNLLYMLSCPTVSKRMGQTGQHVIFRWKLTGVDEILKVAEIAFPKDFERWKSSDFRDSSEVGVLVYLKELMPDLSLQIPSLDSSGVQVCVGDLLTKKPIPDIYARNSSPNDSEVLILNSEGVTDISMAYGLIYRFHLTESTFTKGLDITSAYISWSGEADPQLRSMQLELWLGIPFVLPGNVPPAPGSGPSFDGGPSGSPSSSPSGGGSGKSGPNPYNKSGGPSSSKSDNSSPSPSSGGLGSGIKGLASEIGASITESVRNELPGLVQRAVSGYVFSGGNPAAAFVNAAYPYAPVYSAPSNIPSPNVREVSTSPYRPSNQRRLKN